MTQYIDKDILVAEIEKLKDESSTHPSNFGRGRLSICIELMNFLDTLEVKDVDLGQEIEKVKKMKNNFEFKNDTIIEFCAKHFFELGLKSKEG